MCTETTNDLWVRPQTAQLLRDCLATSADRGRPLQPDLRRVLEAGLEADLSLLRLHTDPLADVLARSLRAAAVTYGSNVFLRADAYRPDTVGGFSLLAHEATHVVQQSRAGALPDQLGARIRLSSPSDPAEQDAERVAALLAHGWRSGARVKAAPVEVGSPGRASAAVLQRHVSFEHRLLGDALTADLVAISTNGANRKVILQNQIALLWQWHQNPLAVTESDVQKLCPWIRTLRLGPSRLLVTYGELNALPDYLADAVAFDTVAPDILLAILQVIRQEGYNQLTYLLTNTNPSVTFQYAASAPWSLSLVNNIVETRALDALTDRLGVNSSNHYQGLLARNACHFAPFSWYRWQASHLIARDLAQRAHAATDTNLKARLTQEAWVAHGYGDHFLEDSFAAGHLLNKTLVMQWFVEWAAGQSLLPVADWDQIKNMTTARQPNLGGLPLYTAGNPGPSNDPQTSEECATLMRRMMACGVVPDGLDLPSAYQHYLTFLSSAVTQLASANVHDYFNDKSLWVSSVAQPKAFEVWGDDTLLSGANGGDGVAATSGTAQISQEALKEILASGSTGISVQSIRDHFPTSAGQSSTGLQDLKTFNTTTLRSFCTQTSFPSVMSILKDLVLGLGAPRLGVVSRDQNLTNIWDSSLPSSGFNPVDVLTSAGRVFAGTNGYVYELDPSNGTVLHSLLVTGSIGVGDYTTRLATDGQTLFVGVHGYVYGIALNNWTRTAWSVSVGGTSGITQPVSVLVNGGNLYAGANGYAYQLNPANGQVQHSLLLTSLIGSGDYTTRLGTDGQRLYVGVHGYVYGIALNNWSSAAWNASLTGWAAVTVLPSGGSLYAGSNGYVYQLNPSNGQIQHSLLVTGSIGVGDYTTRLATDGQTLFVGVHGYVYGVALNNWSAAAWNSSVGGTTGLTQPVSVLMSGGNLFVGANGYAYQLSRRNGSIVASVLLASPYWVGNFVTELASDGQDLVAGTHGYAYKVLVQATPTSSLPVWGVNAQQAAGQNNIYRGALGWKGVPGYLTWVSAAADGTVWGVDAQATGGNNVYRWNGTNWVSVSGYLTQVAVGAAGQIWGVNAKQAAGQNNIYQWNGTTWVSVAGYLTQVAVAADGTVWGVNAQQAAPQNNIYRWNGTTWVSVAGRLTEIALGADGTVWGVNAQQPATQNNIYVWSGSNWSSVAGYLTGIAVAPDGTVWGANSQVPAGQSNVYAWNGVGWDLVAGYLTQIAVGASLRIWGVNATQPSGSNNIYQGTTNWQGVPGYLTWVSAAGDGSVWGVNAQQPSSQNNIYRWNGTTWMSVAGYLTQVAASGDGAVWGVNAQQPAPQNNIYRWNGTTWTSVAGYLTQLAVAADGTVWGVNGQQGGGGNNVYVWDGISSWDSIAGYLTCISVAADGTVWGVNAQQAPGQNNIYRWNGNGWDGVAGYLTELAAAADGTIWGVDAKQPSGSNNIYRWNGSGWDSVAGYLTEVAVGAPAVLVGD
jgi:tectonin-like protein/uncharacterized protein DUF4157